MARTGTSRVAAALGGVIAALVTLALVVALGYAFTHMPELQDRAEAFKAGVSADSLAEDRLDRAADDAMAYADDLAARTSQDPGQAGDHTLSHPAPAGVDAPAGHWCSADEIGYRIDFTTALQEGSTRAKEIDRWEQAFDVWTEASGGRYRFTYLGEASFPLTGGEYPVDPMLVPEGEIAITYGLPPDARSSSSPDYRHRALGRALGIAGVGPIAWSSGGLITRGMIVLDARDAEADPRAVPVQYRHEAGHALGLSHTADIGQLMYSAADSSSTIGAGDRAGIRKLASLPCD